MNVDLSTSDGAVKCELRMMDGSVVAAGTVDLHHGTGVLSKKIHVDTNRLQGATLYSPSGAAVGSATFT
jgi:formylmethanofuran dehydrogenase subunit C